MDNKQLDALDLLSVLISYISLHNYEQNVQQNEKLDKIIYDIERKLEYQDNMLQEILRKVEGKENGK